MLDSVSNFIDRSIKSFLKPPNYPIFSVGSNKSIKPVAPAIHNFQRTTKQLLFACLCNILLLSAGCMSSPKVSFKRNGVPVWSVQCNGGARSIADCHKAAAKTCDGKYSVVDQETSSFTAPMGQSFVTGTNRTMLFQCK